MNVWCVFYSMKPNSSVLLHIFDSEDSAKAWIESLNNEAYSGRLFYEPRPLRTWRDLEGSIYNEG